MAVTSDLHGVDYWEGRGLAVLIAGFMIAPLAWLFDLQASYSLVKWACAHGSSWMLLAIPFATLTAIGIGLALSGSCLMKLRPHANDTGGTPIDRSYLLAVSGVMLNVFFGLLILTSFVPRYLLSPCE
jgi:hypothetical protein